MWALLSGGQHGAAPSQARGLKQSIPDLSGNGINAAPSQARGLKHFDQQVTDFLTWPRLHRRED